MLNPVNVSLADYINAVKTDRASHVRITFLGQNIVLEDDDIESSGLTMQWYLNGDTDLTMGRAMMASLNIPIIRKDKLEYLIWGGEFTLEIGQEVNDTIEWTLLGYFQGNRPAKVQSVQIISFTAHDRMNQFDVLADDWIESLEFPMTVADIYHSLCDYCGVEYVAGDELPGIMNRSYDDNPIYLRGIMCRDVLAHIAEACCCYAKINTEGKCQLVWFADHTSDYSLTGDDEYPPVESFDNIPPKKWSDLAHVEWGQLSGLTWHDLKGTKELFKITGMNIVDTVANAKYSYPDDAGRVAYMIVDNPFLALNDDVSFPYIADIYNRLEALGGYLPVSVDCVGNALIEAGDIITVTVGNDTLAMPIFVKSLRWNGGMIDHYETTGELQRQEVSAENLVKLSEGGRYKLVMQNIELIAKDKYDKQSNILIEPEGISVSGGKYVKIESGGTFDVDSTNFQISSEDKKMVSGYWTYGETGISYNRNNADIFYMYPGVGNYPDVDSGDNNDYIVMSTAHSGTVQFDAGVFTQDIHDPDTRYHTLARLKYSQYEGGGGLKKGGVLSFLYSDTGDHDHMTQGEGRIAGLADIIPTFIDSSTRRLDIKDKTQSCDLRVFGCIDVYQKNANQPGIVLDPYQDDGRVICKTIWAGQSGLFGTDTNKQITLSSSDGVVYAYGFYNLSSREVKDCIKEMESQGALIDKLNPVTFTYKGDQKQRYGLIYEEVETVIPDLCSENNTSGKETKAVNYIDLISILLKETQDLRKRVAELEKRVSDLERS